MMIAIIIAKNRMLKIAQFVFNSQIWYQEYIYFISTS